MVLSDMRACLEEDETGISNLTFFYFPLQYQKFVPSLKVWRGIQPKCSMLSESHSSNSVAASSESGSVASEYEAWDVDFPHSGFWEIIFDEKGSFIFSISLFGKRAKYGELKDDYVLKSAAWSIVQ